MSLPTNFTETLALRESERIASNMTNLATAHVRTGELIISLEKQVLELKAYQLEVATMGARDPATVSLDEVVEIYSRHR